jgi:glutamyl/glutaminyl-tRNA synthetase
MSKRDGTTNALEFIKKGYLPNAVLNQLMFLGWNPGTEKEIYSLDEFIHDFDINRIHKTDLVSLDFDKLNWFNNIYIQKLSNEEFLNYIKEWSHKFNTPCSIFEIEKRYKADNEIQSTDWIREDCYDGTICERCRE